MHAWIFWEMASAVSTLLENSLWCTMCTFTMQWQQYCTCCLCLVVITSLSFFVYTACMDILGNGIISHFGVYSAHLLCNGSNSCCLCLAFTVRFIHKHQLPMVLEDSTAENPLYLFVVIILQTLYEYTVCLNILGNGISSQHSVGKFTVVYNVHIYYTMATILFACVLW